MIIFSFYFVAYLFFLGFLLLQNQIGETGVVGGSFSPIEVQQMAAKRNVQWMWSDGTPTPGPGEMTNVDSVLPSILKVYSGEFASVAEMNFQDPNVFSGWRLGCHSTGLR